VPHSHEGGPICFCGSLAGCSLHCSRCGADKDTPITYGYCQRCTAALLKTAHEENNDG
jgi:hypothetical protein